MPSTGSPRARALRLRARQEGGPRPHDLQPVEAHHAGRPRRAGPRPNRSPRRSRRPASTIDTFVGADHRRARKRLARGAADRLRRGRRRRLFRRRRLSGRQGLGRDRVPGGQRRARLCAGDLRQLDAAALSRRRRHHGLAVLADPPRRPRRGQDPRRRGMAKELKRRTAKTLELQSLNAEHRRSARFAVDDVLWIARIVWASQ